MLRTNIGSFVEFSLDYKPNHPFAKLTIMTCLQGEIKLVIDSEANLSDIIE